MTLTRPGSAVVTFFMTAAAMTAFAANSLFCRFALERGLIDAATFSSVRIVSGAVILAIILAASSGKKRTAGKDNFTMAGMLTLYAITFSTAYMSLSAGTGALILFGAVQSTMIITGLLKGERLAPLQWTGLSMAVSGLCYLMFPGLSAPSFKGAVLMTAAGVAWGVYSLMGRRVPDATVATAWNFIYAVPMILFCQLFFMSHIHITRTGVFMGILSGSIASGTGYVIWYTALKGLTASRAAIVQLTVPVIAALGGLLFLNEPLSLRLVLSGTIILAGVFMAMSSGR